MNTRSPPNCLSTEIKDVTGSIIRLDQPSFDWLSIALGWPTSHFGGVSKGFSPAPPAPSAGIQKVNRRALLLRYTVRLQ